MKRFLSTLLLGTALTVAVACLPSLSFAADIDKNLPADLTADQVEYDQELEIIKAKGDVEILHGERVLKADTITYNQREDLMTASGNIVLLEPSGDVLFADYMEVTGDMKNGVIKNLRIVLSDSSRIASRQGTRTNGNMTVMDHSLYTPCWACKDDPTKEPVWQIKSVKVIHDQKAKTVEYKDAWLEVKGTPVFYTPYFRHPDPTVKRKSGFLVPSIGSSSDLGVVTEVPYYWVINDHADATVTPIYTSKEGPVLLAEYRHKFKNGEFEAVGSATEDSKNDFRGHVFSKARYDIDKTWRTGFDVELTEDDTYLRRYSFGHKKSLTTQGFIEGFRRRNYFSAEAMGFRGLQETDDSGQTPLVTPLLNFNHVGEADRIGGRTTLDFNTLVLTRTDGTDTRRISGHAGWELPILGPTGGIFTFSTALKADGYHTESLERNGKNNFSGFSGRIHPEAALHMRYPMLRQSGNVYQLIEPIAAAIISPNGGNSDNIPNEESLSVEFDDTTLFSHNRYTGLDRVEGGARVSYGLKWGVFGTGGGKTTAFIGQSYRFKKDPGFGIGSGLEDHFSDYVANIHISPGSYLDVFYRTRISQDNFEFRRNEVQLNTGKPMLRFNANYLFFEEQENSELEGREEFNAGVSSQITKFWRANFSGTRDLTANGGLRRLAFGITYEDECLVFETLGRREFFQDRDLEPTDSINFRVVLKTLGELGTGINPSF